MGYRRLSAMPVFKPRIPGLTPRTFNPKVVGSNPTRPMEPAARPLGARALSGAWHYRRRPGLRVSSSLGDGIRSASDEIPRFHLPLALHRDGPPRLVDDLVIEQLLGRSRDLDPSRGPLRLHAAGSVYGVAPEVVEKPLPADHAGHDRSRVDPDPKLEPELPDRVDGAHRRLHV